MKKILISIFMVTLLSCNSNHSYTIKVVYTNGETDTLIYNLPSYPELSNGGLASQGAGILINGVRSFKVLKVQKPLNKN